MSVSTPRVLVCGPTIHKCVHQQLTAQAWLHWPSHKSPAHMYLEWLLNGDAPFATHTLRCLQKSKDARPCPLAAQGAEDRHRRGNKLTSCSALAPNSREKKMSQLRGFVVALRAGGRRPLTRRRRWSLVFPSSCCFSALPPTFAVLPAFPLLGS